MLGLAGFVGRCPGNEMNSANKARYSLKRTPDESTVAADYG